MTSALSSSARNERPAKRDTQCLDLGITFTLVLIHAVEIQQVYSQSDASSCPEISQDGELQNK